tara:strand:- start:956 stop:1168 length:213 start_codon:yes stop_codon:yes gene_type:complete
MPYHMNKRGRKTMVKDPNNHPSTLTDEQKGKLRKHSKEQTPKHMALMNNLMKSGDSFETAHKKASKTVGK